MTITKQHIKNKFNTAFAEIFESASQINWADKLAYAQWLAQTYYYVAQTTRMLTLAAAKSQLKDNALHLRFIIETKEELNHERLCLNDLNNLGFDIDQFPELPETAFFYQTLSYLIEYEHPSCLIGYSVLLEGFCALKADEIFSIATQAHGAKSCTFLKLHCEVDKSHFSGALKFIDECKPEYLTHINKGIDQCLVIYKNLLKAAHQPTKAVEIHPL